MIVDVLEVRGLRRTFASHEDEGAPVRALRGIDLTVAKASSWPSWGHPDVVSRRC